MGYPMTFKRLIYRNGLKPGDGYTLPRRWDELPKSLNHWPRVAGVTDEQLYVAIAPGLFSRCKTMEGYLQSLHGDLDRLLTDTRDESAICGAIADDTGIDPETVARVLGAYLDL